MNHKSIASGPKPSESGPKAVVSDPQKAGEFLAAERTFLAWMRTSISVISLGFVVAKFGVWLRELALRLNADVEGHSSGLSLPIGIGMMATGGVLALLALWHYHVVTLAIERGQARPNRAMIVTIALAVTSMAALVILYLLIADWRS